MNFVGDENILELNRVVMAFGGLMALSNLSFKVKRGMIKAIIGPNGAGKTTLFNIITGSFPPTEGSVMFKGLPIEHLKAHKIQGPQDCTTGYFQDISDSRAVRQHDRSGKCDVGLSYSNKVIFFVFGISTTGGQAERRTD